MTHLTCQNNTTPQLLRKVMEEFVGLNYDSCSPSQSPVREKSPAHHDQGRSPPRSRSASPPSRMNTITPRPLTMSDAEFSCLKNREKRSHNRRMRSRNLLQEKHLVDVMQELYTQVFFSPPPLFT